MDPISALVAVWVVMLLLDRLPEAVAEIAHAARGEVSPAYEARMRRLADAGIDPASGGAFRQYVGNAWRDLWLDMDRQRVADRAARAPYRPNPEPAGTADRFRRWVDGLAAGLDAAVAERVGRWRQRRSEEPAGRSAPGPDGGGQPDGAAPEDAASEPPAGDTSDRGPVQAEATLGDPVGFGPDPTSQNETNHAVIEGEVVVSGTEVARGGAVTGVVSGAAEARAIQRALEAANDEYVAALLRLRNRMGRLGEQTLSIVQMSGRSRVVALLVQAAEAAAAAQAAARACGAEVGPLMGQVGRAFDALNS